MQKVFKTIFRVIKVLCLTLILSLSSCLGLEKDEPKSVSDNVVRMSVYKMTGLSPYSKDRPYTPGTKAIINSYDDFTNDCAPGGGNQKIGFCVDLAKDGTTYRNVFDYENTYLQYFKKAGSPEEIEWNYTTDDRYWDIGGSYHIRAFYPFDAMVSEINKSSSASSFAIEYNTHQNQEDLMVAYNRVNTVDPVTEQPSIALTHTIDDKGDSNPANDEIIPQPSGITESNGEYGYNQPFDLSSPIPLVFQHTLAAIRIRFGYDYKEEEEEEEERSEEDELYSCYFTNSSDEGGLHTVGSLLYGEDERHTVIHNIDERMDLESRWRTFSWYSSHGINPGDPFYEWGVATPDPSSTDPVGIPFTHVSRVVNEGLPNQYKEVDEWMAIAYTGVDCRYHFRYEKNGVKRIFNDEEIHGTRELVMKSSNTQKFNTNDGWLLIVPQKAPTNLVLHFETKKLGHRSIAFPAITNTNAQGGTPANIDDHYFVPGHRYVYTVRFNTSDYVMHLHISDWDELFASEDIDI